MIEAEEMGISSKNIDEMLKSDDPGHQALPSARRRRYRQGCRRRREVDATTSSSRSGTTARASSAMSASTRRSARARPERAVDQRRPNARDSVSLIERRCHVWTAPVSQGVGNIFLARSRSGHVSGLFVRQEHVPLASMVYVPRLLSSRRALARDGTHGVFPVRYAYRFRHQLLLCSLRRVGRVSRWLARDRVGCG